MPRLLITGGSGTLGGPLSVQAVKAGWDTTCTYLIHPDRIRAGHPVQLDLRERDAVEALVLDLRPDVIIHTAVTERSGDGFEEAIWLASRTVAGAAAKSGARLIGLSTDLVFDGSEELYTEESFPRPHPNSVYGFYKLDGEWAMQNLCPTTLIVRTSLIYDFQPGNAQVAWMLRTIERGEPVRLFTDQIRCPIWAFNLADALLELAGMDITGMLHVVGPEPLSRYDLGMALLRALGIDPLAHVVPATAPDTMPRRLVLSVDRARSLLKTPLLTVDEAQKHKE